jgi:hypothetical protein
VARFRANHNSAIEDSCRRAFASSESGCRYAAATV